jgi:hypothetical protein
LISNKSNSGNENIKGIFSTLLQLSLWGNKCDLSISAGASQTFSSDPLNQVSVLHILKPQISVKEVIESTNLYKELQHKMLPGPAPQRPPPCR